MLNSYLFIIKFKSKINCYLFILDGIGLFKKSDDCNVKTKSFQCKQTESCEYISSIVIHKSVITEGYKSHVASKTS